MNISNISLNKANKAISNMKDVSKNKESFNNYFKEALDKLNNLQSESNSYNKMLASGQADNIHEVMIASEKANIALQFTVNIQNKVIDAYKEIMRMQI